MCYSSQTLIKFLEFFFRSCDEMFLTFFPFLSTRSASIPGWSTSGGGLPSPQAAGWGSETGHQTPQERKQQTQGTLRLIFLCYGMNSGWWGPGILTQTTFDLQAEKMRAQLAALPPLCPPKLPQVSKESSMPPDGLNTGIYRRTDQLLATLLKLSSEVKVVDVTGKTAGVFQFPGFCPLWVCVCVFLMLFKMEDVTCSISVLNPVSASAQLLEQTARLQNLSTALDKLKVTTSKSSILCKMLTVEQNQTFSHLLVSGRSSWTCRVIPARSKGFLWLRHLPNLLLC